MLRLQKGAVRASARAVMNDLEPEWPEEHQCESCGHAVWRVVAADGEDVELHPSPLETELVGDLAVGVVRVRLPGNYRRFSGASEQVNWKLLRAGGWQLHDPECVHTDSFVPDLPVGDSWLWFASPVPLTVENEAVLWTEHIYVCQSATRSQVLSHMFSDRGLTRRLSVEQVQAHAEATAAVSNLIVSLPSELRAVSGPAGRGNPTADQLALF